MVRWSVTAAEGTLTSSRIWRLTHDADRKVPATGSRAGNKGAVFDWQGQEWFTIVWAGGLEYGDRVAACVVLNVSASGAMIRLARPLEPGSAVKLWSHQLGKLACRVAWHDGGVAGLRFDECPGEIAKILAPALPAPARIAA